jgi:hypothetical protein
MEVEDNMCSGEVCTFEYYDEDPTEEENSVKDGVIKGIVEK